MVSDVSNVYIRDHNVRALRRNRETYIYRWKENYISFFLIPRSNTTSTRLRTSFIETATNWRV